MDRPSDSGDENGPSPSKSKKKWSPDEDFPNSIDDNSCQVHVDNSSRLLERLRNLYDNREMCDVTLKVGTKEFHAHRLILCASSDVFQAMLMHPEWREWHESVVQLQEQPQCIDFFHLFLEYFYTGQILITHTNVMPILSLADKYMVKKLASMCIEYMCRHVPHAASHNQLFAWLQYTNAVGHEMVAESCQNHIKWNFEAVANTPDYSNFDMDMLVMILQQDDIVVHNEMVLYNCIVRWLELQNIKLQQMALSAEEVQEEYERIVLMVMKYIRFPMMTPRELAGLLLSPLVKQFKEFFVDRMAIGMSYHSGTIPLQKTSRRKKQLKPDSPSYSERFLFIPRLYTADSCSAYLTIDNFWSIPSYHVSTYVFSSHLSAAEHEAHKVNEWIVDLYPKGVWFKKSMLIIWQGTFEVPEEVKSTVRLTLTARDMCEVNVRVRISVLIYGIQGGVEHVLAVREAIHHFNDFDRVMNIDDLIPFEELNPPSGGSRNTKYLVGENRDQLKLNIVLAPVR